MCYPVYNTTDKEKKEMTELNYDCKKRRKYKVPNESVLGEL